MEFDHYRQGFIVYTDAHALMTSDGTTTHLIAGNSTQGGYREGVGADAKFGYITGFAQISEKLVIVADTNNHKIRILDLKAKAIDSICSGTEGHTNGNFNDCQMSFPRSVFSRSIISRDKPNSTTLYYDPYLIIGESGRIRKVGSKLIFLFYLKYALPYLVSDFTITQLERLVLWLYP